MSARTPRRGVLVATDFSETADEAVRVAAEHSRRSGAALHLMHVVVPTTDARREPRLERLAAELTTTVPVVTAVRSGIPAACIVEYAAQHDIELIVVGTHGRTGVSRALIGSVAERVVRTAPCLVLTVPRGWRHMETPVALDAAPEPRRCVVCATVSEDLICQGCRARIRGEALERKQREERAGRP